MECAHCQLRDEEMPYVYNTQTHHCEPVCVSCQAQATPGTYLPIVPHAA